MQPSMLHGGTHRKHTMLCMLCLPGSPSSPLSILRCNCSVGAMPSGSTQQPQYCTAQMADVVCAMSQLLLTTASAPRPQVSGVLPASDVTAAATAKATCAVLPDSGAPSWVAPWARQAVVSLRKAGLHWLLAHSLHVTGRAAADCACQPIGSRCSSCALHSTWCAFGPIPGPALPRSPTTNPPSFLSATPHARRHLRR